MLTFLVILAFLVLIIVNIILFHKYCNTKHLLELRTKRLAAVMEENKNLFFDQFKRSGKKDPIDEETFH